MENKKKFGGRMVLYILLMVGLFCLFGIRLMEYQIVDAQYYKSRAQGGYSTTQTIQAARGEILDRYGRPLAVNEVTLDVRINEAYIPKGQLNTVIEKIIRLMESQGQSWIDTLPITTQQPFSFLEDEDSQAEIESIKTQRKISMDSDATVTLDNLLEEYGLEEMTDREMARKICGVRYEMEKNWSSKTNPYTFSRDVPKDTVLKIQEYSFELPGVEIVEQTSRSYVDGDVAPHVVGITGRISEEELTAKNQQIKDRLRAENPTLSEEELEERYREERYIATDFIGQSGLESAMEDQLRGKNGKRQIIADANGNVLETITLQEATPGNSIITTIDKDLQRAALEGCEAQVKYMQQVEPEGMGKEADRATAVAIDVKTGEVLAMANYPSYDLSTYRTNYSQLANDPLKPLNNYATRGIYMPGSIFKPAVAIGSLAQGVITPSTEVYCQRIYTRFEDYQPSCLGFHREINVVRALTVSCNVFFYEAGYNLGIENMERYANQLGLGVETGIEIGESTGRFSSPATYEALREGQPHDPWSDGNVIQAAIGQLDTAFTPLQLAVYTATLANDGARMRAHLVKSVESYNFEETVEEIQPQVLSQVEAPQEAFDAVREGMVRCSRDTVEGSARYYFGTYPITVAAKTGTPQNTGSQNNATFIAYAPAEDPQIAVAVVIENGYSGQKGAPIARAIFDEYFGLNQTQESQVAQGQLLP